MTAPVAAKNRSARSMRAIGERAGGLGLRSVVGGQALALLGVCTRRSGSCRRRLVQCGRGAAQFRRSRNPDGLTPASDGRWAFTTKEPIAADRIALRRRRTDVVIEVAPSATDRRVGQIGRTSTLRDPHAEHFSKRPNSENAMSP
jgi:hypothetical protein